MTVDTGGDVRGWVARWLMRLQASGGILRMAFLGVTAASTLTSALSLIGLQKYAPVVLAAGVAATFGFAYAYVDLGIYNRKNREANDHGTNFSGPNMLMDDTCIGAGIFTVMHGRPPTEEELEQIEEGVRVAWEQYRDGVPIDDD